MAREPQDTEHSGPTLGIHRQLLAQFPIFATLPPREFDEAFGNGHVRRVAKGSPAFRTNSPCVGFSILLAGTVRVVKVGAGGREVELYRLQPGESCLISTSCMLGKANYAANAVAETDLLIFTIPPSPFKTLLSRNEALRDFVFSQFSARLADLMMLVEAIAFQRLDQRLAAILLEEGGEFRGTQQQLAERLGTVRDIIGRLLKNFEQRGLVALSRERIRILDAAALRALADRPA